MLLICRGGMVGTLVFVLVATLPVAASPGVDGSAVDDQGSASVRHADPGTLDIDRLVGAAVERVVLLQRTRSRPTSGSSNDTMRWVGLGMLGLGGILAINGALSTCGARVSGSATAVNVETSACWTRAGIGAGIAAAGFFVMNR